MLKNCRRFKTDAKLNPSPFRERKNSAIAHQISWFNGLTSARYVMSYSKGDRMKGHDPSGDRTASLTNRLLVLRLEIREGHNLRVLQSNDLPVAVSLSGYDCEPTFSLRHLLSIWSYLSVEYPNGVNDCYIGFDEFDSCVYDRYMALPHHSGKN